jgi:hypothetical protein
MNRYALGLIVAIILLGLVLWLTFDQETASATCMCNKEGFCSCSSRKLEGFTSAQQLKRIEGPYPPLTVFVINLDERKDRWKRVSSMLDGLGVQYERFPAVRASPGWVGCGKSHIGVAQEAKRRRLMWVLVLEDDCIIEPADWKRFQELLPWLWKKRGEWTLFNGGLTFPKNTEVFDREHKIMSSNGYAAHFLLYTPPFYDIISAWDYKDPIDVYIDKKVKAIAPYPLIAQQEKGDSDIVGSAIDYDDFFKKTNRVFSSMIH